MKKRLYNKLQSNSTVKIRFGRKKNKIMLACWKMENVGITSFFNFYTKLAESSFLYRFRIESVNVLFNSTIRFSVPCASSSTINFAHAQTFSRMKSLSGRMNMRWSTLNSLREIKNQTATYFLRSRLNTYDILKIFNYN